MKKYLFNAIQTLLVFSLAFTLTSCWNFDNPLEDLEGSGGGGGSTTIKVTSITLDQTTLNKNVGDAAVTLTATVKPDNATEKTVTWSSSDKTVATVADGVVTFVGAGTAIITATAKDGSGVEATCEVTLKTPGLLAGKFSVSDTKQVQFSQGNLQATYDGSSWTWAFATNQWDYIGNDAGNTKVADSSPFISENGTVDLFGWVGESSTVLTSDPAKYGISNSSTTNDYGTKKGTEGETLKSDWGTLAISNGGNTPNYGWRTLTSAEWTYLFNTRTTTSDKLYAKATVNGKVGVILLPDDWNASYYALASANIEDAAYTTNEITADDWTNKLEAHGAVFLPAAGRRNGMLVQHDGSDGRYWSSSPEAAGYAYYVKFSSSEMSPAGYSNRYFGHSVRLVRDAE